MTLLASFHDVPPNARQVSLAIDGTLVHGALHLVSSSDYFEKHFCRFFDIPPSTTHSFAVVEKAHNAVVIAHPAMGVSWSIVADFPTITGSFVAVTDEIDAFRDIEELGTFRGDFTPATPALENVILAFPSQKPIATEYVKAGRARVEVHTYPPIPVTRNVLEIIDCHQTDAAKPQYCNKSGELSKNFVKNQCRDLLNDDHSYTLSRRNALYPHRNNIAILNAKNWEVMCVSKMKDAKVEPIPEMYSRYPVEDLRERKRWGSGDDRMVEGKYLVGVQEQMEAEAEVRAMEMMLARPMTSEQKAEARDGERWLHYLMR
ncbi:hypothetical protein LTR56_001544 [Elasticomyces elasticus]|nr:hypothetical protein LTR56_001544 [Elasticomyces elasticus]KAK5768582.1 hypothetical protein LTS12_001371 [Elasticomyces elasticus]